MGAPGLAFETWDPSNQFLLETPARLFVIRSAAERICGAPEPQTEPTGLKFDRPYGSQSIGTASAAASS
jgi:hypothetical protein